MTKHSGKIERIAVFSVSAGSGHVRAALALKASADLCYPGVEVVHVDLMELVPKLFRTIYTETYIKMIEQHPALWGYLYDKTDRDKIDSSLSRLRSTIENLSTRKLKNALDDIAPDHVICTHFLPAQLFARRIVTSYAGMPIRTVVHYNVSSRGFSIGDVTTTQRLTDESGVSTAHFETRTSVPLSSN